MRGGIEGREAASRKTNSAVALGTSIRLKLMKRILPFSRMVECLSVLLPVRGLSRRCGRRADRITFKRQRKEEILSSPWRSWAVFLWPILGHSHSWRILLLSGKVHIQSTMMTILLFISIFEELQFLFWLKSFLSFQAGGVGGLGAGRKMKGWVGDQGDKKSSSSVSQEGALSPALIFARCLFE